MKSVQCETIVCSLVLFLAELCLAVGSEGINIKFPSFPGDDHLMIFGDVEYNPAHQSHIINAAARNQTTGSCGEMRHEQQVRIQEVATGRVASFNTSFSFTFTTYGKPWDAGKNPTAGSGFGFGFAASSSDTKFDAFESCAEWRNADGISLYSGFGLLIQTEYAPYRGTFSNNYIEIMKNYDNEVGNPAYSHNLCGHNRTHCSYFSNGRVFTAWLDFSSSSKTLEVRLAIGSEPNVTRPVQPLLRIPNYNMAKDMGDDVYISFWGYSGVNHFEEHEVLSWSFFSPGIPVSTVPSFLSLLQFSKTRTNVGIMIGVLGTVVTLVMLWTISLLARSFRGQYRSIRDPVAGPRVFVGYII